MNNLALKAKNVALRKHRIRVVLGDKVTVALTPYDPTRGIVVYRG